MSIDECELLNGVHARMWAYCSRRTRRLLTPLISSKEPISVGGLSEASELGVDELPDLLSRLLSTGLLTEVGAEYRSINPKTGESVFYVKLQCPHCGSFDLVREELVEHRTCGFIGKRSEYKREGGRLICPNCGNPLRRGELLVVGSWYTCKSCNQTFPKPNVILVGTESGMEVKADELNPVRAPSYELSEVGEEARLMVGTFDSLEAVLESHDYKLRDDNKVRGASGAEHEFCMVAERGDVTMAVDIAVLCGEQGLGEALRALTKAYDASFSKVRVVLLAIPEPPPPVIQMLSGDSATSGRFHFLYAKSVGELPQKLEEVL